MLKIGILFNSVLYDLMCLKIIGLYIIFKFFLVVFELFYLVLKIFLKLDFLNFFNSGLFWLLLINSLVVWLLLLILFVVLLVNIFLVNLFKIVNCLYLKCWFSFFKLYLFMYVW